ncbi:hypothetical protein [Sphingobacterium multivorum]|uniref:3-oxoacyl-ACP synthase n=1 Tax=Sphingobacterium multivorum TaxID=28454 RepID=A0ABX7CKB3_SPHMU|nr:hypothetical protein [Sphingobacterium multivorum]QQT32609.1 hypothetical protein I6I99_08655 [Sphingobacterium multivorum]QQT51473.1 hypothetical protein I6I98_14315 [Sphingobacterium multivorum]
MEEKISKAYIGGFCYTLGENELGLDEVGELNGNKELIRSLRNGGFEKVRESDNSVLELLGKSISKFLDKTLVDPGSIDAIIIATSSLGFTTHLIHSELSEFLIQMHLQNAYPILSSLSFCGNLLPAINSARSYVSSGIFKNVLVVIGDIIPKNTSKLTPPSMAIGSDASACCLITKNPIFNLEIEKVSFAVDAKAGLMDPDKDFMNYTKSVGSGIRQTIKDTFNYSSEKREDITQVFTNNYSINTCKSFLRLANVPERLFYDKNIARFGHAGATDILINISDYLSESMTGDKNSFLLLCTGPFMWSSTLINQL